MFRELWSHGWLTESNTFSHKNGSCKNCGKFNDNHIYSDYCDLCKNDKNALKLEISKYIRKRNY